MNEKKNVLVELLVQSGREQHLAPPLASLPFPVIRSDITYMNLSYPILSNI